MNEQLKGKKIAFLISNGFNEEEFVLIRDNLHDVGATTKIVSEESTIVKGFNYSCNCNLVDPECWGKFYDVDFNITETAPDMFDALIIPGGILSVYYLKAKSEVLNFIHRFYSKKKLIACSSNGMYLLTESLDLRGMLITSDRKLKTDLVNAGAIWLDKPVVEDKHILTCRATEDTDKLNIKLNEELSKEKSSTIEKKLS